MNDLEAPQGIDVAAEKLRVTEVSQRIRALNIELEAIEHKIDDLAFSQREKENELIALQADLEERGESLIQLNGIVSLVLLNGGKQSNVTHEIPAFILGKLAIINYHGWQVCTAHKGLCVKRCSNAAIALELIEALQAFDWDFLMCGEKPPEEIVKFLESWEDEFDDDCC